MTGILLIDKPRGRSSFSLIPTLRKLSGQKTIGHAGTLDPFATGVMVMLLGRTYTRLATQFLQDDKEYTARIKLGEATDTFDCEGKVLSSSEKIPTSDEIEACLAKFQGTIWQTPPMFSAKKVQGKKLYELARRGIEIERKPVQVTVAINLLSYNYPYLDISVTCSKGTYIRSLADDIGKELSCFGHLVELKRTRSGTFHLKDCLSWESVTASTFDLSKMVQTC